MKKIALKLALVTALFAALPMSVAQRGAGPIIQELRGVDQQSVLDAAAAGLVVVQVVASNVNVEALNNIAVIVDLTNVLRDANLITDNQIVVGVNVLGDQTIVSVLEQ